MYWPLVRLSLFNFVSFALCVTLCQSDSGCIPCPCSCRLRTDAVAVAQVMIREAGDLDESVMIESTWSLVPTKLHILDHANP